MRGSSPGTVAASPSSLSAAQSLNRINREVREITNEVNPFWCAYPVDYEDPYEWHFTIRGPIDSDFEGGLYHGRILLPSNYPFTPPSVMLLTQNGRFEVGKKVCLSATNYHPELWQPAWGLRTMLDALHAFFPTPGEGALHSLDWPKETRIKVALESVDWTCPICKESNANLVRQKCTAPTNDKPILPESIKSITIDRRKPQDWSSSKESSASPAFVSPYEDALPTALPVAVAESTANNSSNSSGSSDDTGNTSSSSNLYGPRDKSSSNSTPMSSSRGSSRISSSISGYGNSVRTSGISTSTAVASKPFSTATIPTTNRTHNQPPHRHKPPVSHKNILYSLISVPKNIYDLIILISDVSVVFLVGAVFILIADIVVHPPSL